jgi:hypothetical protein
MGDKQLLKQIFEIKEQLNGTINKIATTDLTKAEISSLSTMLEVNTKNFDELKKEIKHKYRCQHELFHDLDQLREYVDETLIIINKYCKKNWIKKELEIGESRRKSYESLVKIQKKVEEIETHLTNLRLNTYNYKRYFWHRIYSYVTRLFK